MSQNRHIKKWLNIIIIVISALVLAFMLIGKLMERDKNQPIEQSSTFFNHSTSTQTVTLVLQKIEFKKLSLVLQKNWQLSEKRDDSTFELSASRIEEIQSLWQQILLLPTEPININSENNHSVSDTDLEVLSSYSVKLYFKTREKPLRAKVTHLKGSQSETTKILFSDIGQQLNVQGFYFKRLGSGAE